MTSRTVFLCILLLVATAAGCEKEQTVPTDLRWRSDIEPIIERSCVGCHSEADTLRGPNAHGVNLEGYDHVRRHRKEIYKSVFLERAMPGRVGDSLGIRISDEDRLRVGAWVKGGTPR